MKGLILPAIVLGLLICFPSYCISTAMRSGDKRAREWKDQCDRMGLVVGASVRVKLDGRQGTIIERGAG